MFLVRVYIRFLVNICECIYLVSFWGYKKYTPYFIWLCKRARRHVKGARKLPQAPSPKT